jgi:hypothetical protein
MAVKKDLKESPKTLLVVRLREDLKDYLKVYCIKKKTTIRKVIVDHIENLIKTEVD